MSAIRQIFFTADIITPDGSDTGVYGDPCETGAGATLESGWVDMNWSRWTVYEKQSEVRPESFIFGGYDEDLIDWAVKTITEAIGSVEEGSNGTTYYGADAHNNYSTGASATYAAHLYEFTEDEISAINAAIQGA